MSITTTYMKLVVRDRKLLYVPDDSPDAPRRYQEGVAAQARVDAIEAVAKYRRLRSNLRKDTRP